MFTSIFSGLDYETAATFVSTWRLIFFILFFAGMLVWTFRPGSKKIYSKQANIILKEDN